LTDKKKIVIAGSTGYIGQELLDSLADDENLEIIGISRSGRNTSNYTNYQVEKANLFSLKEAERAMEGGNIGVFLVHSMLPSDRLAQGKFEDFDYIIADNFARTAKKYNYEKIIYLSGLIPKSEDLSPHLKSRLEVEKVLGAYGTPCMTIRAGLIIGAMGSSFQMMLKLVERLPILICPSWCENETQVVGIETVIDCIKKAVNDEWNSNYLIELGCSEITSYKSLLESVSNVLGKKRFIISIKSYLPFFSKFWVSFVTNAPRSLTSPLVESLKNKTVKRGCGNYGNDRMYLGEEKRAIDLIEDAVSDYEELKYRTPYAFISRKNIDGQVTSVQRMKLPQGVSGINAAQVYIDWLCKLPFINTRRKSDGAKFKLPFLKPILRLSFSSERSSPDRALYYVTGGILAKVHEKGRFEFRETVDKKHLITALHNFRPRLPWYIYSITQAPIHKLVMKLFASYMALKSKGDEE
jgi:uncharacterized protein YbjT (DUF2867 family)